MNKIQKLFGMILCVITALSVTVPTVASDDLLRGRVGISSNSFTSLYSGGQLEADFMSLNFGATYITDTAVYFDFAYKQNLGGTWSADLLGMDGNGNLDIFSVEDDYNRTDLTLTAGMVLENGIQVFGGYQDSDTDIAGEWQSGEDEGFDVSGFFIGAGKSLKISNGSLNLNAAFGSMEAILVDGFGDSHTSSSGSGYSIGATYSIFVNDSTTANFELKQQNYNYDFDTGPSTGGDDKMTMFGVNLIRSL